MWGTQHIYGEVSPILLGPQKTETTFMIFSHTKHRLTDIFGFTRGNHNFSLHCFRIFYAHVLGEAEKGSHFYKFIALRLHHKFE